jgi:DHA1 family putative efflux transporter-like MFS transporter
MIVQIFAFAFLPFVSGSVIVAISLLLLWAIAAWTFGPTQSFNLATLAPEASGIMLSLNSSFVQLGFAAGAGIGGIAVGGSSILAICWIGAISVTVATVSFGLARRISKYVVG